MTSVSTTHYLVRLVTQFVLYSLVLVPLWWLCIPGYGWLLVQGCGSVLKYGLDVPLLAGRIETAGILNTQSLLVFYLEDRESRMPFALLVTNLAPFLALVLATPGLDWRRRARVIATGSAVLVVIHGLFIIVMLRFGAQLQAVAEVPTAIAQFFLTLPFLLWIVLAYWGNLPSTANDSADPVASSDPPGQP